MGSDQYIEFKKEKANAMMLTAGYLEHSAAESQQEVMVVAVAAVGVC